MNVMKNKKVAYRVDCVAVNHCTKFRFHICNIGNFTEGAPRYYKGPKSPVLIGLRNRDLGEGASFKNGPHFDTRNSSLYELLRKDSISYKA